MAKNLEIMTASEIAKADAKGYDRVCKINRALIEAGRCNETGAETRAKSDKLSLEYIAANDAWNAINAEIAARKRYHGGTQRIIRRTW
jgi:hypothetical protein